MDDITKKELLKQLDVINNGMKALTTLLTAAFFDEEIGLLSDDLNADALEKVKTLTPNPKPRAYVAVFIGHDKIKGGAFSRHLNMNEFQFWSSLWNGIKRYIYKNVEFHFYTREPASGVSTAHMKAASHARNHDIRYAGALEFHFNAFRDAVVWGSEVLYAKSPIGSIKDVANFSVKMAALTSRRNRGAKVLTSGSRGYFNVSNFKTTHAPYLLVEPFFGTNKSDCDAVRNHKGNLMSDILDLYVEVFGDNFPE